MAQPTQVGVGCFGYPQTKVDQQPKYDNAVRKGRKRKKKKDKHGQ